MERERSPKNQSAGVIKVRTAIKAGKIGANHSTPALAVRSGVKAGKIGTNHSRRLLSAGA